MKASLDKFQRFTLGIEEEFQIVDPEAPVSELLRKLASRTGVEPVSPP